MEHLEGAQACAGRTGVLHYVRGCVQFTRMSKADEDEAPSRARSQRSLAYAHRDVPVPIVFPSTEKSGLGTSRSRQIEFGGGAARRCKPKRARIEKGGILRLTAGQYLVTEQDRRTRQCEIVVTP
jgi:hypothetical protein